MISALSASKAAIDETEWDGHVARSPNGHLLQSYRWGELKARHGWSVDRFVAQTATGTAAAQVLWRRTPLGPLAYVPRGPAIESPEAGRVLLNAVHETARVRRAIFLKVEPNGPDPAPWHDLGFHPSQLTFQPRATLMVDLLADLDAIRARLHPKWRYNAGLAARKGVTVRHGAPSDLPAFFRLSELTGARDGFGTRSLAYYRDIMEVLGSQAELLLAEHEGELLAGILVASFNDEAIYLYGASGNAKRSLMPNHLLQWEAICDAKARGFARYDLWGVPPDLAALSRDGATGDDLPEAREGRRGDLWGVYRFKRGFGGRLQLYAGAYDYVYNPAAYWLWEKALPLARRVLTIPGAPGFHIHRQHHRRAHHAEQTETVQRPDHLPLRIPQRVTQPTARRLTMAHPRPVHPQPDPPPVVERLIPFRPPGGRRQRLPRRPRGQPLGKVGQGVVAEPPAYPQRPAGRRPHQGLHPMEAPLPEHVPHEQRPEQHRGRNLRPPPPIPGAAQIPAQP